MVLFCPECDDDLVTDIDPSAIRTCTVVWLKGQTLRGDRELLGVECACWEEDPYPPASYPHVPNKRRRFFHYRTIAWLLGLGKKECVDLPECVKEAIAEAFGESSTGFLARSQRLG